ncbi:hypothetical protein [Myroides odoratus]|uniref:hypothetical protein n=1 Tax=Myroides odoratus TaxID=256 RepID=UPI0039AFDDDE
MNLIKKIILLFSFFVFSLAQAQVTIGGPIPPNAGALLDLKENNNPGINSTKGLLMPRVALEDERQLAPVATNNVTAGVKAEHKGLMLYNTYLDTSKNLCPGIYIWEGDLWRRLYGNCYSGFFIDTSSVQGRYLLQGETHTIRIKSDGKWTLRVEGDTEIFVPGSITPSQGRGGADIIEITFKLEVITTNVITQPTPTLTGVLVFVSDVDGKEERVDIVGEKIYWNLPVPTRQINDLNTQSPANNTRANRGIAQTLDFDVDGYFGSRSQLNLLDFTNSTLPFTLVSGAFEPWVKFTNGSTFDIDICNEEGINSRQNDVTLTNGALILDLKIKQEQLNLEITQRGPINYTADASPITSLGVRYNTTSRRQIQTDVFPVVTWLILDQTVNRDPKLGVTENTTNQSRTTKLNVSLLGHVANKQSAATKVIAQDIIVTQEPSIHIPFEVENLQSSYVMDGLQYSFLLKASGDWTANVISNSGAIDTSSISSLSGTGNTTISFNTTINSTTTQNLSTVLRFTNASGSQVKDVTIIGVKMDITVPNDLVADADGYINNSPRMNFIVTSNSTRPISITYPSLANATNNIIDVNPTINRTASNQEIIRVSNGVMTKEVKIHQLGLVFTSLNSILLNANGNYASLGLNLGNTRRTSNATANASWLNVINPTSSYPSVSATSNTGDVRFGSVTVTLNGYVPNKNTVSSTNRVITVSQEKKAIPTPQNVMYWMQYAFGSTYYDRNNYGIFVRKFQLRSIVFAIQGTVGGEPIRATYTGHWPNNPAVIQNIGLKPGTSFPMFDINADCQVFFKDQFNNRYVIRIHT